MAHQCMNALADKVQKQEVTCTQWYALYNMAALFNNHLYISSSGMPCSWHKISCYLCRDGCWIIWPCYAWPRSDMAKKWHAWPRSDMHGQEVICMAKKWHAYHCVHVTSCFCTLSASAFMHWAIPALHGLDFLYFYGDLHISSKTSICIEIFDRQVCSQTNNMTKFITFCAHVGESYNYFHVFLWR